MSNITQALSERLVLIDKIKEASAAMKLPDKVLRGPTQTVILDKVGLPVTGWNRRLVNEVMGLSGYRCVIIHGNKHFSRKI